jgi:serine protease Do
MNKRLFFCCFALGAAAAASSSRAQEPARPPGVSAEKAPSVIPAPRAEPVVPPSPAKSIATQLNDAYVNVFERVAPTVVVIDVYKRGQDETEGNDYFQEFFHSPSPEGGGGGKNNAPGVPGAPNGKIKSQDIPAPRAQRTPSEGSGFIIQSSGFILTNDHVVNGATSITVRLKDGRQFPGKLVGSDDKTDIAVLKIEAADLPTAELADSDALRVGEIACAIGVPYSQDYSFTAGVVSAKGRKLNFTELRDGYGDYNDYIQTDASINPGNSGGPLVNLDGKVIGMNALIRGFNRGLGFAIPSNMLRQVGDQLIHMGRVVRSYIGVRIESVEDTVKKYGMVFSGVKKGVIVTMIQSDSPAYKSDLRPSDVILEVDGAPVSTDRDLQKMIHVKKVGSTVQLTVLRRNKTIKVPVVTAELPAPVARTETDAPGGETGEEGESPKESAKQFYGLQVQELTRDMAERIGVSGISGVLVTSVTEDSPAARVGIGVKDVITSIDDRPIKDVATFKEAIKAGDPKRGISCIIQRLTDKSFVVIKTD